MNRSIRFKCAFIHRWMGASDDVVIYLWFTYILRVTAHRSAYCAKDELAFQISFGLRLHNPIQSHVKSAAAH